MISEDRKQSGLVLGGSIRHNISLSTFGSLSNFGLIELAMENLSGELGCFDLG